MKKSLIMLVAILAFKSMSFGQSQNVVYETTYLKPKTDNLKVLDDKMKAHNQKYHAKDPYRAAVWRVLTGEHSGNFLWVMGPFTFSDLDNRPSTGGHDDDWMEGVMPLVHGMKDGYYWKLVPEFAYAPTEEYAGKVMRIRTVDIKRGKSDEFNHMMTLIMKVYNEKKIGHSIALFGNWANDGDRDVAIVWQYDNYAYMDQDLQFSKLYEEVHGDNSWNQFNEAIMEIVDSSADELLERAPELSAD